MGRRLQALGFGLQALGWVLPLGFGLWALGCQLAPGLRLLALGSGLVGFGLWASVRRSAASAPLAGPARVSRPARAESLKPTA